MIKETTLTQTYSSAGQTVSGLIEQTKKRENLHSLSTLKLPPTLVKKSPYLSPLLRMTKPVFFSLEVLRGFLWFLR
ncbi:hypothetical protein K4I05_0877 [Streptococcus sanguinis]|nr:hypothetical protein [Streptococcus sanguinis]